MGGIRRKGRERGEEKREGGGVKRREERRVRAAEGDGG